MKLRTVFLTVSAFALAAACTPASEEAAAPPPAAPPIADAEAPAVTAAAENTSDSLTSAPSADQPAPATPAPPAAPTPASSPTVANSPTLDDLAIARPVYAQSCAMCHGPTGQGTQMGVALTAGLDQASIKEKVVKGMINPGDKMPPMGAALTPEQLNALAKFVEAGLPQ